MSRRKRRGVLEINLTALLDVLFCILFIVMLANAQNEKEIKVETQEQIEQLREELAVYKNQVDTYENHMDSFDLYHTQAVIVTMRNVQEEGSHKLLISEGDDPEIVDIPLGLNRVKNTSQRISGIVNDAMESTANQPVYIVFHCNKNVIYTGEYNGILDTLTELQNTHKEVFYQVVEDAE